MTLGKVCFVFALGVLLLATGFVFADEPSSYTYIGDSFTTEFDSFYTYGISPDGTAVVGAAHGSPARPYETLPYRWTAASGVSDLGCVGSWLGDTRALAASTGGAVVVGFEGSTAFRWTAETGMVGLGAAPGGLIYQRAWDITPDGSVIVGVAAEGEWETEAIAFRWTAAEGMVALGAFPDAGGISWAYGVSADGSVVVGQAQRYEENSGDVEAFRWTADGGMVRLGVLAGPWESSTAHAVSADGTTVVGETDAEVDGERSLQAFRWTESTGMVGLGYLDNDAHWSRAYGVSSDGSVVVGLSVEAGWPYGTAFIWDEHHGMRDLRQVLINTYGLTELADKHLETAKGISDDGKTICGIAGGPWIAVMGDPVVPTYHLTVNSGWGDGDFPEADVLNIRADWYAGMTFDHWAGDVATVADVSREATTITMPASGATVTAAYTYIPYWLTVTNGTGDGGFVVGDEVAIAADPPAPGKLFAIWIGATEHLADEYSAETVVTMPAASVSVTAVYTWGYDLTVNSGSGSGQYIVGTVVEIDADAAPAGQEFGFWSGDIGGIADVNSASTTLTMPAEHVEITANYVAAPLVGDLDGNGAVGQSDLDIVLDQWGRSGEQISDLRADPSGDGNVGQDDLDILLDHWGMTAP